ncbi:S-adenosyl-L-methionine-dependent methyltransferase [Exophiala viscosa]|uniref:S-adenosyl-L-methionine-dependent methyltransferase n=1 Tax=Exophiala viscosa TaxID=2486360 RepID=UPI00219A5B6C|nr:S-adenosyl-L-methionine-dependent methyltransferase [Exophiala viscosa]
MPPDSSSFGRLHSYIFSRPDLEANLRNNPNAILSAIDDYTAAQRMITFGLLKITKCRELLSQMDPPPKVLVELGTYIGNSAIGWGEMLRSLNPTKAGCRVFTCELDPTFASIARDLIDLAGLSDIVTVLEGAAAADSLRSLKTEGVVDKADVLFFDHWQEAYLPDLKLCEELQLLRKGSLVLADNTAIPGTPDYNAYLASGEGPVKYHNVPHETSAKNAKIVLASTVVDI